MNIGKKVYQVLTPKQRAVALYSAINRDDEDEADRLIAHAPRDRRHRQAIFALGQALDAYNCLTARATTTYLDISSRLHAALSFCSAWLGAGGAIDNQEYREKVVMVENLTPLNEQLAGEVESIRQAAWEWCKQNEIPTDFFSGPLCHLPMPKEVVEQSDIETLRAIRSVFDKITLDW